MIALFQARGVDVLFPQHQRRKSDFRKGRRLGRADHVVTWNKPKRPDWLPEALYQQLPETLQIREFRNGRRVLVTTLVDASQASVQALSALYRTRWHGELDLRAIKHAYSTPFGHPFHADSATQSTVIRPGRSERSDAGFWS